MTNARSLSKLLVGLPVRRVAGEGDPLIERATIDSRNARSGVLFVACRGATPRSRDGHDFVAAALAQGAAAVVVEREEAAPADCRAPCFVAPDTRRVAAVLAERTAGEPSRALSLVGVTGTNGKTTVTFLLADVLAENGRRAAVLGTVGVGAPGALRSLGFTTPEAEVLSRELAQLRQDGFTDVAMEVSSHALATERVDGLRFAAAAFTNLSQDHLDFHGSFEAYFAAKARLFSDLLADEAAAVLPAAGGEWAAELRRRHPRAITWGLDEGATVRAEGVELGAFGARFTLAVAGQRAAVASALLGAANLENLLCAAGCAHALGLDVDVIARGLSRARPAPGRMERIAGSGGERPLVVVDYAHTPDALARALDAARSLAEGRVIVVFGCGGDRDRQKRPLMAAEACRRADVIVLTDDNPRS